MSQLTDKIQRLERREHDLTALCAEICATFMISSNERFISQELKLLAARWKARFDQIPSLDVVSNADSDRTTKRQEAEQQAAGFFHD